MLQCSSYDEAQQRNDCIVTMSLTIISLQFTAPVQGSLSNAQYSINARSSATP